MARLIGVDLPREKRLEIALTYIYGVGRTRATATLAATGISPDLRVKDLDLRRREITVRQGKGARDRMTMVPESLLAELADQLDKARALWRLDRDAGRPGVELPNALERKYRDAATSWSWFWTFPAATPSRDPRSGVVRRHHVYPDSLGRAIRVAARRAGIAKPVTASSTYAVS